MSTDEGSDANLYEPLRESFSTADAEYPRILSEDGFLRVTFRDWQEKTVRLVFHDVVAYSWDEDDAAIDARHRDDCCYIVRDSQWLARHHQVGTVTPSATHQHFKLCFNAAGVLQVLASRLEVSTDDETATEDGEGLRMKGWRTALDRLRAQLADLEQSLARDGKAETARYFKSCGEALRDGRKEEVHDLLTRLASGGSITQYADFSVEQTEAYGRIVREIARIKVAL